MPVYEYECETCGAFAEMRPMAEYLAPCACPECAAPAPRVVLTAPKFACMPANERKARAVNERSRHEPMTLDQYKAKSHAPGCGCCSGKSSRLVARTRDGAKGFPTARPWMISH